MNDYLIGLILILMIMVLATYSIKIWYMLFRKRLYMNGVDLAIFAVIEARRHKLLGLSGEQRALLIEALRDRLIPLTSGTELRNAVEKRFAFSPTASLRVFSPELEHDIMLSAMIAENCGLPVLSEALNQVRGRK